jgi:outer membrane protein assembly factor BamB
MADIIEDSGMRYESLQDWAQVPDGWSFYDCPGVTVDSDDYVYVLSRSEHPIMVFDMDGKFVRSFGEGQFNNRAHGIHAGADGFIYTVNDNQHCIKKWSKEGELVLTVGREQHPADKWSGEPFNTPTNMGVAPTSGDIYVTDGYGNARVHRYDNRGEHITSWGAVGMRPGEFQIPHNVVIDRDENVFVTDRENNRVQVFDNQGNVLDIWQYIYRPQALCMDRGGLIYIGEHLTPTEMTGAPGLGHRVNVYSHDGHPLARLGDEQMGDAPTEFVAAHGLGVDSRGNLFVGEVSHGVYGRRFDPPRTFKTFRKLARQH